MEDPAPDPKGDGEEAEEHEEGEISDEESARHSSESEEAVDSSGADGDAAGEPAVAPSANISRPAYDGELPPVQSRAGHDDPIEWTNGEVRKGDILSRARGLELDSAKHGDDGGGSLKRNGGWGAYGSNLYNIAWATAVSGRPTFPSAADTPGTEGQGLKHAGDALLSSRSGIFGSWGSENHRKLSRTLSRDSQYYGRSTGRSSEERDDLSPLRENGSRVGERGSLERGETTGRGRRTRETSWSDWDTLSRTDKPPTLRSKIEKASVYPSAAEDEDYHRRVRDGDDLNWRKKRTEFPQSNGKVEERESRGRSPAAQSEQNGQGDGEAAAREEGELEEGEIELASLPAPQPPSPAREPSEFNRQSKYGSIRSVEHSVEPKDWSFGRSVSSKSLSRPQADDYSSRRYRQAKALEIQRARRLSLAGDLVKNVTVKDAQKSFVDVCARLHRALRVLEELYSATRKGAPQEGWMDTIVNEIAALAKQAFAGIRAVHAVRNTASGREQERDKNIFPRLLELANGSCQKLFTPKQVRELENMMQTIANAGRAMRDLVEKGQYQRDQQVQPAPKKNNDIDGKQGNDNADGKAQAPAGTGTKNSSEGGIAGRGFGFVDAKQAEEAAGIAAAALAYAQSSAAARASAQLGGSNESRAGGAPLQGTGTWGWLPDIPSQIPFSNSIMNSLQTNYNGYNLSMVKYQPWGDADQRSLQLSQDGYGGHLGETMLPDRSIPTFPHHLGPKDSNAPPGYSKSSGAVRKPEDNLEGLKPPGAGLPTYAPLSPDPILSAGVKEESVRSQVWPPALEMGVAPPLKRARSTTPQFNAESVPNVNHLRNGGTPYIFATDRLPSPTPDEDDHPATTISGPSMEVKPRPLDGETTGPNVVRQPERGVGGPPNSAPLPGLIHSLKRTQSLEDPRLGLEPKIQNDVSGEVILPFPTLTMDETELIKIPISQQMLGAFRSRDPRRRFHNHSLDLTNLGSTDLRSQIVSASNPNLEGGLATGSETKKRLSSDVIKNQDVGVQKRQKGPAEGETDSNGFKVDSLQESTGTGGWLDDNIVPSFSSIEEAQADVGVIEDDTSTGLEGRSGMEVDGNSNGKIGESGPRKMKPRDPRRVFISNHLADGPSDDSVRTDGLGTVAINKVEASLFISGPLEVDAGNWQDGMQASKQGAAMPQYVESQSVIARMVSSSSLPAAKNQQVIGSGGIHVSTVGKIGADSVGVGGSAVSPETTSHVLPDQPNDKPPTAGMGPRKKKGSPSQWGASHVHPGLELLLEDLSDEERLRVQLERKRRMEEQDRMFSAGKLCLVLDLDHTLLNSAKFSEIEQEWDQRLRAAESAERNRAGRDGLERRELFRFPHMSMWTKLRPGIWKFLARASQLYELHVYTMGNKVYATEMAKLLDPTGKLFAGRVISKGDDGDGDDLLPKSKDLDGVLGMESAVVIIDDSARVWPHHSENLIVVERYMYFPCSRRQFGLAGPSLLEVGHDERESDGMLASALGVIDKIHQRFFNNPRLREVDVREILAAQQRQVLAGCKVVFSRVFPVGEADPHRHPLWRTAEQFGAICTINIDEEVTHIVAISLGTDKVNWALETGRYVVRPAWLEASTILYRRANERDFPVLPQ